MADIPATATETPVPPKELEGFALRDPIRADFKLLHPDWVCSMAITRGQYRLELTQDDWVAHCSLSVRVCPMDDDDRTTPRIAFAQLWTSSDGDLGKVHLVGGSKGFDLRLPSGEIGPIAFAERQKLLDFLGQLRGVELNYTPNLFGFLRKDGSDKPIVTAQPFPIKSHWI